MKSFFDPRLFFLLQGFGLFGYWDSRKHAKRALMQEGCHIQEGSHKKEGFYTQEGSHKKEGFTTHQINEI